MYRAQPLLHRIYYIGGTCASTEPNPAHPPAGVLECRVFGRNGPRSTNTRGIVSCFPKGRESDLAWSTTLLGLCVHNRTSLACISTGDSWIDRARWGARRLIAPDRRLTWNAPCPKSGSSPWLNRRSDCESDGIFDVKRIILTKDGRSIGGWAGNPTRYGLPSVLRSGVARHLENS